MEFYFTLKTLSFMVLKKNYTEILPTQNLVDPNKITQKFTHFISNAGTVKENGVKGERDKIRLRD